MHHRFLKKSICFLHQGIGNFILSSNPGTMKVKKIRDVTAFTIADCNDICEFDPTCAIFSYNLQTRSCSLFHSVSDGEYDTQFVQQNNTVFYYFVLLFLNTNRFESVEYISFTPLLFY